MSAGDNSIAHEGNAAGATPDGVFAEVPKSYHRWFQDRSGVVFFSEVLRINRDAVHKKRCVLLTEACLMMCTRQGTVNRSIKLEYIDRLIVSPSGTDCLVTIAGKHDLLLRFPSATLVSHAFVPAMRHLTFVNVFHLGPGQAIGDRDHPINFGTSKENIPERDRRLRRSPPLHSLPQEPAPLSGSEGEGEGEGTPQKVSFGSVRFAPPPAPEPSDPPFAMPGPEEDLDVLWRALLRQATPVGGGGLAPSPLPTQERVVRTPPAAGRAAAAPPPPPPEVMQAAAMPGLPKWKPPSEVAAQPDSPVAQALRWRQPEAVVVEEGRGEGEGEDAVVLPPAEPAVAVAVAAPSAAPAALPKPVVLDAAVQTRHPVAELCPGCAGSAACGCAAWCPSGWFPRVAAAGGGGGGGAACGPVSGDAVGSFDPSSAGSGQVALGDGGARVANRKNLPVVVCAFPLSGDGVAKYDAVIEKDAFQRCALGVCVDAVRRIELRSDGALFVDGNKLSQHRALRPAECVTLRVDRSIQNQASFRSRQTGEMLCAFSLEPRSGVPADHHPAHELAFFVRLHSSTDRARIVRSTMWAVPPEVCMYAAVVAAVCDVVCTENLGATHKRLSTVSAENTRLHERAAGLAEQLSEASAVQQHLEEQLYDERGRAAGAAAAAAAAEARAADEARRAGAREAGLEEQVAELRRAAEKHANEFRLMSEMLRRVEMESDARTQSLTQAQAQLQQARSEAVSRTHAEAARSDTEAEVDTLRQQLEDAERQVRVLQSRDARRVKDPTRDQMKQLAGVVDALVVHSDSHTDPTLPDSLAALRGPVERLGAQRRNERRILSMSRSRPSLVITAVLASLGDGDPESAQRTLQSQCPEMDARGVVRRIHVRYAMLSVSRLAQLHTAHLLTRYFAALRAHAWRRRCAHPPSPAYGRSLLTARPYAL